MGLIGIALALGVAVLMGRQCERTKQAEREAEYAREMARRKGEATQRASERFERQTKQEVVIDKARAEYEKDRSNKEARQKYMDAVRDWHR